MFLNKNKWFYYFKGDYFEENGIVITEGDSKKSKGVKYDAG
jgi:hypothetical protein